MYSAVLYCTILYCSEEYSRVHYSTQYSTIKYSIVQYSTGHTQCEPGPWDRERCVSRCEMVRQEEGRRRRGS